MTENERIAKLTADAKKGDTAAFEALYASYGKRVYYFCRGILGDESAAIETTKDAFLYAWRNMRSLQPGQTFYRWICGNAFYFAKIALASLREKGVTIEEAEGDPSLFDTMNAADGEPSAEPSLRKSDLTTVTELLDKLPDGERICVLLYDYAGFSAEEAASIAGCSVDTLKYRVYIGHEALCTGLNAHEEGFGDTLRPYLNRLLRTCGRNCLLPSAVTDALRAGLNESDEDEFTAHEMEMPEGKSFSLSKKMTTVLYILLGLLLVGGLAYVIYWFATAPKTGTEDTSSNTQSTVSGVSGVSEENDSSDETSSVSSEASSDTSSENVSSAVSDESEPEESSEESSLPEESSEAEESSEPPSPAELPRTTANLRLREQPDTSVTDNIVTMIPANTHIDILETVTADDGSTWYFVRYTVASGMWFEGYCSADYVQTEE